VDAVGCYPTASDSQDQVVMTEQTDSTLSERRMASTKKTLSLDVHAAAALERVGNVSDYVSRIVQASHHRWNDALGNLVGAGWTRGEILVGIHALNGILLYGPHRNPNAIRHYLQDPIRIPPIMEDAGVDPTSWASKLAALQDPERFYVGQSLANLAEEYWTRNEEIPRAIERVAVLNFHEIVAVTGLSEADVEARINLHNASDGIVREPALTWGTGPRSVRVVLAVVHRMFSERFKGREAVS
jgi:hypothetical protein